MERSTETLHGLDIVFLTSSPSPVPTPRRPSAPFPEKTDPPAAVRLSGLATQREFGERKTLPLYETEGILFLFSLPTPLKKAVVCFDSFKNCLSSKEACELFAEGFSSVNPNVALKRHPIADGGEGTLECLSALPGFDKVFCDCRNAVGKPIKSHYVRCGDEAYFETASCAGASQTENLGLPVERRTTHGLGMQIAHAIQQGNKSFYVGLGGSCTNDAGAGLVEALGVRLEWKETSRQPLRNVFDLEDLTGIDFEHSLIDPSKHTLVMLCDVANPLLGRKGATRAYGPQKGVRAEDFERFEKAHLRFAKLAEKKLGRNLKTEEGTGAAGGLGFGLKSLRAERKSGAVFLIEKTGLEREIRRCQWAFTGEGFTDAQSFQGKLPLEVAAIARRYGTKTFLVSGGYDPDLLEPLLTRFAGCFSLQTRPESPDDLLKKATELLRNAGMNLGRILTDET